MLPQALVNIFCPLFLGQPRHNQSLQLSLCLDLLFLLVRSSFIMQGAIAAILASVTSDQISIDLDLFVFFHKMSVLWYTQSSSWLLSRDVTSSSYFSAIPRRRCKIYNLSIFSSASIAVGPRACRPTLRLLLSLECRRV